jgi:glycosyltransferase involved in cell wall biosynthesis
VLPSPAEPFGLVLLEAMALSKPVVACSSGGPIEIVSAGETGLLVPPSNAEALAAALRTLLENRDLAVRFGERGRARYERMFTSDRMGAEVLAVYRQVLGAGVEEADARMLGGQSAVES